MTLREYLFGRRLVLRTLNREDQAIERIKRAAPSRFGFMNHGISGGMFFGRLRLAWDIPLFGNGFRPVFRGRFVERRGATELHTVYGAPPVLQAFLIVWYLFLIFFCFTALVIGITHDDGVGLLVMIGAALALAFFPIGLHLIFNAKADEHYQAIPGMLACEAALHPITAQ